MEELQNSEFLEKEILDDARKKAERTLRASEKEKERLEREWEGTLKTALAELDARYDGLKKHALNQIQDSLPLERQRRRLAFFEKRFSTYLDSFFLELDQEVLAGLIISRLEARKSVLAGRKISVKYSGLDEKTARDAVQRGLGAASALGYEPARGQPHGLVVTSEDGELTCKMTVDELKASLRRAHRAMLGRLIGTGEEPGK